MHFPRDIPKEAGILHPTTSNVPSAPIDLRKLEEAGPRRMNSPKEVVSSGTHFPSINRNILPEPSGILSTPKSPSSVAMGSKASETVTGNSFRVYHTIDDANVILKTAREIKPEIDSYFNELTGSFDGIKYYGSRVKEEVLRARVFISKVGVLRVPDFVLLLVFSIRRDAGRFIYQNGKGKCTPSSRDKTASSILTLKPMPTNDPTNAKANETGVFIITAIEMLIRKRPAVRKETVD